MSHRRRGAQRRASRVRDRHARGGARPYPQSIAATAAAGWLGAAPKSEVYDKIYHPYCNDIGMRIHMPGQPTGGPSMSQEAVVIFTFKSIQTILAEGGSSSWRLDRNHARRCPYAVCTRNAHAKAVQGPE